MADAELRILVGPTASGKSALAMHLAEHAPLTILSADSRQIYRGFDVGTAKPTVAEQARVPHRGIDLVEPRERYSAARWAARAADWIAEAEAAGRTPLLVGGTGFYIRALVTPLFAEPPLDPVRRRALAAELGAMTTHALRAWCERLDPARAHLGRAQLLRALEIALLTGVAMSTWHARAPRAPRWRARYLVLDPGPALAGRIAARVQAMLARGWDAEVAALARAIPDEAPAWNATGYAAMRELVRGRVPRAVAIERVVVHTRQYAKRQRTWFRHQLPATRITRLDPAAPDALARALEWWQGEEARR